MSGFGGFGQQPQQQPAFGSSGFGTSQSSLQTPPAAPFGSSPAPGFGQATTSGFGFGGTATTTSSTPSGFGASNTTMQPFGSVQPQQQSNSTNAALSFGTPAKPAFGSSSTEFGMSPAPANAFGGTPSGFGSSSGGAPASFGNASNATGFGSTSGTTNAGFFGGSTNNTTMQFGSTTGMKDNNASFGNAPAPSAFGGASAPSQGTGFGGATSMGFGGNNTTNSQTPGPGTSTPLVFGSSSTVMFGSSSTTTAPSSTFGQAKAAETPAPSSTGFGFGQANNLTAPPPSSGFGQSNSNTTGFGQSSNASGFGQTSTVAPSNQAGFASSSAAAPSSSVFGQSDTIPAGSGFDTNASFAGNKTTTFGFGNDSTSTTASPFGKPAQSMPQTNYDSNVGTTSNLSPFGQRIPRKERTFESSTTGQSPMDAPLASSRSTEDGDEKLAALKAKIQEKKNRLLKMKKGNQDSEGGNNNSSEGKSSNDSGAAKSLTNSELAAKNALRFASNNQVQTTSKLLPTDLQGRVAQDTQSSSSDAQEGSSAAEEEDIDDLQIRTLSGAKDLVGVCRSMCPDEELLRREREGDIQLLEITDPGGLHPEGWTLRDTAVKRFRRSAADFKLDIPELVRPPDVLERVCGYLEEWVMERDRQGPDKRFAQQPSIVPPPLDVYQFIWDRTRMIRKDFILQNYIGDGGKCDARAVRCHERIARWHAMCEHQLSHIQEFVTHQSQQNIAELGQTMKTLNLYYDDALGRSSKEESGDNGNKFSQGCSSDIVMGKSPIDFDGRDLSNMSSDEDVGRRIIGANGLKSSTKGTAEPEMRGLYILLTMNNEGGMEVIKYSGRLCTERPEIFYSKPIQLALSIFQARKDHNYAKFFHLLRSSSTPYLFSCIMFKYVEQMRKTALTIMSRTYGAKHKTTGESFYDEYPVENLVNLLCYEDKEEAITACKHYGITLEGDVIRWRNSKFIEPRDPVKGIILALKPKKMIRTIECKLKGATRLSVCRGGVSGEGATLVVSTEETQSKTLYESTTQQKYKSTRPPEVEAPFNNEDAEENARQKQLAEKQKQDAARREEEAARKEAERKQQEAAALKKRQAQQLEIERQRKALEEKKRLERLRQEEERRKNLEKEALLREARQREAAIKRLEEEKLELARQQLLEKQRKEEERKRQVEEARRKAAEEEKARQLALLEEERRLEQRRLAEEERLRKEREEEERRWQLKIDSAKKILVWSLWTKQIMRKQNRIAKSIFLPESINPTSNFHPSSISMPSHNTVKMCNTAPTFENQLYQLSTASRKICDLSQIAVDRFWNSSMCSAMDSSPISLAQPLILLKLSVVFPKRSPSTESIIASLRTWADSHLQFDCVTHSTSQDRRKSRSVKVQAVSTIGNEDTSLCSDCDAALFVFPSLESGAPLEVASDLLDSLPDHVPRMILFIGNNEQAVIDYRDIIDDILGPESASNSDILARKGVVAPDRNQFDDAFRHCCESLIYSSLDVSDQPVVRVSLSKLSFLCLQRMLLHLSANGSLARLTSPDDTFHAIYDYSMTTLTAMVNELTDLYEEIKCDEISIRPAKEFISTRSNSVRYYFNAQDDLPCNWYESLQDTRLIEDRVFGSFQYLFSPDSFISFVVSTAQKLSNINEQRRLYNMLDQTNLAMCFAEVVSLVVNGEIDIDYEEMPTIYLPARKMSSIIDSCGYHQPLNRPKIPVLSDIPSFLYNNERCYDKPEEHKIKNLLSDEVDANEVTITPVAMHKRKPSVGMTTTPSHKSNRKRSRIVEPDRVEPGEVEDSKDFTSYLEALLSNK